MAQREAREQQIQTLTRASQKISSWLAHNEDKIGASGKPKKSNITDNESAKMKTSKGVIQGYDGIAMVDEAHQIVIPTRKPMARPKSIISWFRC